MKRNDDHQDTWQEGRRRGSIFKWTDRRERYGLENYYYKDPTRINRDRQPICIEFHKVISSKNFLKIK